MEARNSSPHVFPLGRQIVTKLSFAAVSLVAAVPAGFMSYLMVMNFVSRLDEMGTGLKVLSGMMLLICVLVALIPAGILIFAGKQPKETDEDARTQAAPAVAAAGRGGMLASGDVETLETGEFEIGDEEFGEEFEDDAAPAAADEDFFSEDDDFDPFEDDEF